MTIARLLCAMVTIAIGFAVLVAIGEPESANSVTLTPRWFTMVTAWLTVISLAGLLGATLGVIVKGEEGLVMGTTCGVLLSLFAAPLAMTYVL